MMNWEGDGRRRPWTSRGTIPEFAWRDRLKSRESSVRIASVPAEIRTWCLPDTSPKCSLCASPLGEGEVEYGENAGRKRKRESRRRKRRI
jgi:hypothetical protein